MLTSLSIGWLRAVKWLIFIHFQNQTKRKGVLNAEIYFGLVTVSNVVPCYINGFVLVITQFFCAGHVWLWGYERRSVRESAAVLDSLSSSSYDRSSEAYPSMHLKGRIKKKPSHLQFLSLFLQTQKLFSFGQKSTLTSGQHANVCYCFSLCLHVQVQLCHCYG